MLLMPSCVVKSCKNHSGTIKKKQGITFHRFPKSNDPWKNDWIEIIRESRKESRWAPSKSSVVCSIHFEESDLYITKGGLLRVVSCAVPKKFLYETSSNQASTSSASHEDPLEASNIKIEESAEANTSSALHEVYLDAADIKIEELAEENTSSELHESGLVIQASFEEELEVRKSCQVNLQSSLPLESPEESSKTVTPTPGVHFEQPIRVLYTPLKHKRLIEMHNLVFNQKKKIKTLNQKVRRLQAKVKSLKNILKHKRNEKR